MKIQIPINGISTSSDYKDGDMMSLVNLRKKTGVLEPVPPREITRTLSDAYDLVFVHQLPSTKENWIGVKDSAIYLDADNTKTFLCSTTSLISITQIGNVLNILDAEGVKYLLWYDNQYKLISTAFDGEQTDTSIHPLGKIDLKVEGDYEPPTVYLADNPMSGSSAEKDVADIIKGLFNKAISIDRQKGYMKGFALAIAAYELYDGSTILHSRPMLLGQPYDSETRYNMKVGGVDVDYINNRVVHYFASDIHAKIVYQSTNTIIPYEKDENNSFLLKQGKVNNHIATRSGVFYNELYYNYPNPTFNIEDDDYWNYYPHPSESQNYPHPKDYQEAFEDYPQGTYFKHINPSNQLEYVVVRTAKRTEQIPLPNLVGVFEVYGSEKYPAVISRRSNVFFRVEKVDDYLKQLIKSVSVFMTQEVLMYKDENYKRSAQINVETVQLDNYLPDLKTNEEIINELMSHENFYKVQEIDFDKLEAEQWIKLDLEGKLGEQMRAGSNEMPLDSSSYHLILPKKQYTYNSRLHIADYERLLSRGFPPRYFENVNVDIGQFNSKDYNTINTPNNKVFAEVKIETEQGDAKVVRYDFPEVLKQKGLAPILSYPDRNAKSLRIVRQAQGYPTIVEYGVVVGLEENPTVGDNWKLIQKTGSFAGTFNKTFSGGPLQRGTTYHVRAYCILSNEETQYGEDKTFTTLSGDIELTLDYILQPQKVWTDKVEVTRNLIANNGESILEAGVVYGTNPAPTVENSNKTSGNTNIGSYNNTISGLEPATQYYARAYARNKYGVYYSSPIRDFMTLDPTETFEISPIPEYDIFSDKLNVGFAINLGTKEDILDGGIVWSKSPNPYINTSPHTSGITATGGYTRQATGLDLDTVYYVRAWASNRYGVFYSTQVSARTKPANPNYSISSIISANAGKFFINLIKCKVELIGDAALEEWGICYSLNKNKPTIEDSTAAGIASPDTNGIYYADIDPAINNMAYYIRAYAKTQYGISYSETLSIWTLL